MTQDRALKSDIRARMAQTGEKYTSARRAILAQATPGEPAEAEPEPAPTLQGLPTPKGKQKEVLALRAEGHQVVLGTAGSGKTTMAIHRAARLGNPATPNAGPVLVVTFNRALVAYLKHLRPPALRNVVLENYHVFARGYLNSRGKMGTNWIAGPDKRRELIAQAMAVVGASDLTSAQRRLLKRPIAFFEAELTYLDGHGFSDTEYLAAERYGRERGLPRELRPTVLAVRGAYRRLRLEEGLRYDWDDLASAVVNELGADESARHYRHIVVDEGQDFSPQMLRSLAAAIPDDGSLTFFGDMAQQIYGRQVSWRRAGLYVPHGTWKFKRNYRNTPEIAELGLAIAAMPYFSDVPDMVEPDEFEPSGPPPTVVQCESTAQETEFVIEAAKNAAGAGSVGVLMRRHEDEARFHRAFRGGQHLHKNMSRWDPGPGISWGTAHAAKGYEFDTVILVGMSAEAWPEPEAIKHEGLEAATANDGRLLYVGVTRAKQELIITHVGEPTVLLPEGTDLWVEGTP